MTYVIAQPCVDIKDKACIDECPVDCIYEGPRKLYIQPDECVDCGACEPVCPVEAVFYEDDLPEAFHPYRVADREIFDALGSPGSSRGAEMLPADHATVEAEPRKSAV
ncbi:ferredoxin [Streptomyces sp. NPDC056796]|uniref:ferredoxin n=1 Tax=unclassified Streptomyces TaxID=2593676 RepID=UPI0036A9473E